MFTEVKKKDSGILKKLESGVDMLRQTSTRSPGFKKQMLVPTELQP